MEFAQITYTKTVEGNFEVSLINKNTVIAKIPFPTETLAKEYVDLKTKLKASTDALIAEVTANLKKAEAETKVEAAKVEAAKVDPAVEEAAFKAKADVAAARAKAEAVAKVEAEAKKVATAVEDEAKVIGGDVKADFKAEEDKVESFVANIKAKVEKQPTIDTSAKVAKEGTPWQETAKAQVGKDTNIDTSAKVVVE